MARIASKIALKESTRTTGLCRGSVTTSQSVSTITALPLVNLSERTGVTFNNTDTANAVYLWWSLPEYIRCSLNYRKDPGTVEGAFYKVHWKKSATGNEWYAVDAVTGLTPSITTPLVMYYSTIGGGTETLGTSGTPGALAATHNWGFGNADTLGFNTVYIRTAGATAAYSPDLVYDYLLSYTQIPTTSTGYQLLKGTSYYKELDGSVRTFAIASTGTIVVTVVEDL